MAQNPAWAYAVSVGEGFPKQTWGDKKTIVLNFSYAVGSRHNVQLFSAYRFW